MYIDEFVQRVEGLKAAMEGCSKAVVKELHAQFMGYCKANGLWGAYISQTFDFCKNAEEYDRLVTYAVCMLFHRPEFDIHQIRIFYSGVNLGKF